MKIMNSARPRNTSMRGSRCGRAEDDGMDQVNPVALYEKRQRGALVPHGDFWRAVVKNGTIGLES